jgi:phosphatidylserine decarboxylase
MKHSGKARKAAFKIILWSLIAAAAIWFIGFAGSTIATVLSLIAIPVLPILWVIFAVFTLYFFRDPNPRTPVEPRIVVSPGHGKVDAIDTTTEPKFMGGECQRISIFLSVFNVHVQNAPVGGRVAFYEYKEGEFLNALRADSAVHNENVLMGFEATEPGGQKIGVRLIAGVIARRIVPFVQQGEEVSRGQRISLIQFGSRVDVYLPAGAKIKAALGDRVVGGETVLAAFD